MNSVILKNIIRFFILLGVQIIIANHINFLGFINPLIYILFIILYPINENRSLFIFSAFLMGLFIDVFSDSGGINAAACVTVAYFRPYLLRFSFGNNYEFQAININKTPLFQRLIYISIIILAHHFILFSLDFFSFTHILSILKKTLTTGVFTFLLCLTIIPLFSSRK